jgi:predicted lipid-binding transport protein (Tim44 family)
MSEQDKAEENRQPPKRPNFWTEYLLTMVGGYLMGVLAIITCEQHPLWAAAAAGTGLLLILALAGMASIPGRPRA